MIAYILIWALSLPELFTAALTEIVPYTDQTRLKFYNDFQYNYFVDPIFYGEYDGFYVDHDQNPLYTDGSFKVVFYPPDKYNHNVYMSFYDVYLQREERIYGHITLTFDSICFFITDKTTGVTYGFSYLFEFLSVKTITIIGETEHQMLHLNRISNSSD
jgi:hypothetical protein